MHKHCFINFAFIFCPWTVCIVCDQSYTGIAIFAIILECESIFKMCLHTFICLLMAYRFICEIGFNPMNRFMFYLSYVLNVCFCFTK